MGTRSVNLERWARVPGFPLYEVSTLGRMRTYQTQGWFDRPKAKPRLMKLLNAHPYRSTVLSNNCVKRRSFRIHELVLMAFVGPKPKGWEASHLNGNCIDNRLLNLRWESRSANFARKKEHGTNLDGEHHHNARLSNRDIKRIRAFRGVTQIKIAKHFGISQAHVSAIKNHLKWKHIP